MSNNSDLLLSEGTCYFGAGQKASSKFIPCGNANLEGPQACCYEYDYCLSSNTCWDLETVVTYIAGCTDPLFRADVCPQRDNYPDQQWVALARCNGNNEDLWSGCAYHPDVVDLEKENCNCNMSNILVQNPNGKGSFDEIGRLPNKTGQAITFNPTAIPTAVPTQSSGGGLTTGAKAGIGVGVTIAGLLLIVGAVLLFLRRRRNQRHQPDPSELDGPPQYGSTHYGGNNEKSELGGDYHRGASTASEGPRSELSPDRGRSELSHERGVWEMASPGQVPTRAATNTSSSVPEMGETNTNGNFTQQDSGVRRKPVPETAEKVDNPNNYFLQQDGGVKRT